MCASPDLVPFSNYDEFLYYTNGHVFNMICAIFAAKVS